MNGGNSITAPRLLCISNGPVPPSQDLALDCYTYLSDIAQGEVLYPIWGKSPASLPEHLRHTFPHHRVGRFTYHFKQLEDLPALVRPFAKLLFFNRQGLQLHRAQKFDAIFVYGTSGTGVAGVILKWLTGAKLIVELPNVPEDAHRFRALKSDLVTRLKSFLSRALFYFVCRSADCVKMFYPWQLSKFPSLQEKRTVVFINFVPVSRINAVTTACDGNYILSVGFPWHVKGFDILIRAFKTIAPHFPDYKLKLIGFMPDRRHLLELADGSPQIELLDPMPYIEAQRQISGCTVYVSASRTEAAARVIIEAMSARKPVIASAVGGSPHLVKDGECGLLFESENVEELAAKLSQMLLDSGLRERLAERAHERVNSHFDERAYVRSFQKMLEEVGVEPKASFHPAQIEQ